MKSVTKSSPKKKQTDFTVIGYYTDSKQRFADTFSAVDGDTAEAEALLAHPSLAVCAVILGSHSTCESATHITD